MLHLSETSDRLAKWAIKLEEFDIKYLPRPSIKAQAPASFILECTILEEEPSIEPKVETSKEY